ncbi:MAG: ABC transporter substrate-binding protein [Bacillota bacterium]
MIKKKLPLLIIVITLLVINLTGQTYASYPVTIVDDLDREVTIEQEPTRIISLAPSITETIYKLDAADKLVGVTKFCNYPTKAQEKTKVSVKSVESIIAQKPDLVLAEGIVSQEVIQRLEKLGIKIIAYQAHSIPETIAIIEKTAKIIGVEEKGAEITTEMRSELKDIKAKVAEQLETTERPTVFYEIWRQPLRTAAAETFVNDLITTAGGKNIAAGAKGSWPQYSLEKLLKESPEVYIANTGSWKEEVTVEKIKTRSNYQQLTAVKQDRVFVFDADIINRPGPRIIQGLKLFVQAIHPQVELAGQQ